MPGVHTIVALLCPSAPGRFVVPRHAEAAFLAAWRQREQDMQHFGGFQGFNIIHDGEVYTVSSRWAQKDSVLMSIGW